MRVRLPLVLPPLLALLGAAGPLGAELPELVADLGTSTDGLRGSRPRGFTPVAHGVVFVADGDDGTLYVTDGSTTGTHPLSLAVDGCARPSASIRATIDGRAIVDAGCGGPLEVWATDGSERGTSRLFRFDQDSFQATRWVALGDRLYFLAWEDTYNQGVLSLYVTDGTPAGSRRAVHRDDPDLGTMLRLAATRRGLIVLEWSSSTERTRVWASDGTEGGTRAIAETQGRPWTPTDCATRERVFFAPGGDQIWATDGTPEGTLPLTEFATPGAVAGFPEAAVLGETFYFFGLEPGGAELWATDGTRAGTRRVTRGAGAYELSPDLPLARAGGKLFFFGRIWGQPTLDLLAVGEDPMPQAVASTGLEPGDGVALLRLGERLLFPRLDAGSGREIWSLSTGTGDLEPLVDACPGPCWGVPHAFYWREQGSRAFLLLRSGGEGRLFATDGSPGGTFAITPPGDHRLDSGARGPHGLDLAVLGARLILAADVGATGVELAAAPTASEGLDRLADLRWDRPGAGIESLGGSPALAARRELLFGADLRVYLSDGTEVGTRPLVAPPHGCCGLFGDCGTLADVHDLGERLLVATGDCEESEVWSWHRASGELRSLFGTSRPDRPGGAWVVDVRGGRALLETRGGSASTDGVWTTDGTDVGTERGLAGVSGVRSASQPGGRAVVVEGSAGGARVVGGEVDGGAPDVLLDGLSCAAHVGRTIDYSVLAARLAGGTASGLLVATDGTVGGTRILATLEAVDCPNAEAPTAQLGSRLLFAIAEASETAPLWATDGTQGGTVQLTGGWPPVRADLRFGWLPLRDRMLFVGLDGDGVSGLWVTDGTPAGTRLFDDLAALGSTRRIVAAGVAAGRALLLAREPDPELGHENDALLWANRGSPQSGAVIAALRTAHESSLYQSRFVSLGPELVFPAETAEEGLELWRTDGTAGGTRLLVDLAPGPTSSGPGLLQAAGDRLFFVADDGVHGEELWTWSAGAPSICAASDRYLCIGDGRFRLEAFWDVGDGRFGDARSRPLTSDSGAFWLFDPRQLDLAAKVLDGRPINEHFWVFQASLTNVRYALTARDGVTGQAWRSINPLGRYASGGDTRAFGPEVPRAADEVRSLPSPLRTALAANSAGACQASPTRLCLVAGRFAVEASWRDFAGHRGEAFASSWPGDQSGVFWFFVPSNVELVVKLVDGTAINGRYWLYLGSLSDVEFEVRVTDTWTGVERVYANPAGHFASFGDVDAF